LKEYIAFANSIENNRIRRKVESQLGRKAILLRQVLSAEGFSAKLMPVATDHISNVMVMLPREIVLDDMDFISSCMPIA
jgi:hypothetical protein